MILASLSIGWTVDLYSPRKTLARPVWVETMDLQSRPILIKDIKKILSREGIRNCIEGVLLLFLGLAFIVSEHVLEETFLEILVHELRYMHWQHTELVFVLLHQLSMPLRQEIIYVLFP